MNSSTNTLLNFSNTNNNNQSSSTTSINTINQSIEDILEQVVNYDVEEIYPTYLSEQYKIENPEEYKALLTKLGLNKIDSNRVITEQITIEQLLKEIDNDPDKTRKRRIMEAAYLHNFDLNYNSLAELKQAIKNLDKEILNSEDTEKLEGIRNDYNSKYIFIYNEIEAYFQFVEPYYMKDDFTSNISFDPYCLHILEDANNKYKNKENHSFQRTGMPIVYYYNLNSKDKLVDLIYGIINNKIHLSKAGGINVKEDIEVRFTHENLILEHFLEWAPIMTDEERQVVNYIYNTEGKNALYNYLNNTISNTLDNRYINLHTKDDKEFASKFPCFSWISGRIISPIMNIGHAATNIRAYLSKQKLRKTDSYSLCNICDSQIAEDITNTHGEVAGNLFTISTGITDTATSLLFTKSLGGTSFTQYGVSTACFGTKAFSDTLYDAKNRGLSDGKAFVLALTNGIIDLFSSKVTMGMLFSLKNIFTAGSSAIGTPLPGNLLNKIKAFPKEKYKELIAKTAKISNSQIRKIIRRTYIIGVFSTIQGVTEGATALVNGVARNFADNLIAGDLNSHTLAINNYINMGFSEEEARKKADELHQKELKGTVLGGLISGIVFGGFSNCKTIRNTSDYLTTRTIDESEDAIFNTLTLVHGGVDEDFNADSIDVLRKNGTIAGFRLYGQDDYRHAFDRAEQINISEGRNTGAVKINIDSRNLKIYRAHNIDNLTTEQIRTLQQQDFDVIKCTRNGIDEYVLLNTNKIKSISHYTVDMKQTLEEFDKFQENLIITRSYNPETVAIFKDLIYKRSPHTEQLIRILTKINPTIKIVSSGPTKYDPGTNLLRINNDHITTKDTYALAHELSKALSNRSNLNPPSNWSALAKDAKNSILKGPKYKEYIEDYKKIQRIVDDRARAEFIDHLYRTENLTEKQYQEKLIDEMRALIPNATEVELKKMAIQQINNNISSFRNRNYSVSIASVERITKIVNNKSYDNTEKFNRIMDEYFAIKLDNQEEKIEKIKEVFGSDFANTLENSFQNMLLYNY